MDEVFERRALGRVLLALSPIMLLALATGHAQWWRVSLVTVSVAIATDRARLAPLGVAAQCLAIAAGFLAIVASFTHPGVFVGVMVLLGMGSVLVTVRGTEMRSLGNFTFIPALYIACEIAEGSDRNVLFPRALTLVPYLLAAPVPVLLACLIAQWRSRPTGGVSAWTHFAQWTLRGATTRPVEYRNAMITIVLAVGLASALVQWRSLLHGQWVIWSAASVVTGSIASARVKLHRRCVGALVGVPAGLAIGVVVPHTPWLGDLILLVALLSLVGIRSYTVAFGTRCACAAMLLLVTGATWTQASDRLFAVLLGGTIGLLCTGAVHVVSRRLTGRR
jgi:hypothetical protein